MKEIQYCRYGKLYRKLQRNEIITKTCMHTFCNGELHEIINPEETIGQNPANFSDERDFYELMEI